MGAEYAPIGLERKLRVVRENARLAHPDRGRGQAHAGVDVVGDPGAVEPRLVLGGARGQDGDSDFDQRCGVLDQHLGRGLHERPRGGDLIYIEMDASSRFLFNIRFVENKESLFTLGKLYTYELKCEMFNFSNEQMRTGVEDINFVANKSAYTINLDMKEAAGSGTYSETETV